MSVKIFDLTTGKEFFVKWYDKNHVQLFDGISDSGHCCARRDISKFYGEDTEKMLKDVQKIVDKYLKNRKKFDYPGKVEKPVEQRPTRENLIEALIKYQPPEYLTKDLLKYNLGVWYQKSTDNRPINKDTPWFWLWNIWNFSSSSVPDHRIIDLLEICKRESKKGK